MSKMDSMLYPPFLQKGDKVVIITPASKIDKSLLEGAKTKLKAWGLRVSISQHAASSCGCYSGSVAERLSDFQRALDDVEVKMILCSRGGYGAIHLVDKLDFTAFTAHPKWLVGFSDITLLHQLFQQKGFVSIHSFMAHHLSVEKADDPCTMALHNLLLDGDLPHYTFKGHSLNCSGSATGILRGGNLAVMNGMRATPYDIVADGTILFLEDVGECPYHIDRMMHNLRISGVLSKLSGLIIGQFTQYEEDPSLGATVYDLIYQMVKPYHYPVCFDFPIGHVPENYPLICGSTISLEVQKNRVQLTTHRPIDKETE